jgi:ribosomal protein S18 acetylase RimI-like enzyme
MNTLVITRVAERQWHALDDDLVVGRGIAHALLAAILAATRARGVATVSADVHDANTAAIALFEAVGARRTGSNIELVIH